MIVPAIDRTLARMILFRFMCEAYSYPLEEFVNLLMREETWRELSAALQAQGIQEDSVDGIRGFVSEYSEDTGKLLQALQVEYTYLFINAVPRVPAPPYESVYSGERILMGEPVSQVLALYREAGLEMSKDLDILPDHVSIETEFMFYLIQQEEMAGQSPDDDTEVWQQRQIDFLIQHLDKWMPEFMNKTRTSARLPYYSHLADFTEAVLNAEKTGSKEEV